MFHTLEEVTVNLLGHTLRKQGFVPVLDEGVLEEEQTVPAQAVEHHHIKTDDPDFVDSPIRVGSLSVPNQDVNEGDDAFREDDDHTQDVSCICQQDQICADVVDPDTVVLEDHREQLVEAVEFLHKPQFMECIQFLLVVFFLEQVLHSEFDVHAFVPTAAEVDESEVEDHQSSDCEAIFDILVDGDDADEC